MSANIRPPAGLYGRLGTRQIVMEKALECRKAGAQVHANREAGTVVALNSMNGETIFRAIEKGADSWLVMYNPTYYPKPA